MLATLGADETDVSTPFKVWTPSDIKAELAQTNTYFDTVRNELLAFLAKTKPTDTKGKENLLWLKFHALHDEWIKFLAEDPSTWFVGTVDKARKFRSRVGSVVAMLNLWGWKTVVTPPEKGEDKKKKDSVGLVPVLIGAAATGVVLGVLLRG